VAELKLNTSGASFLELIERLKRKRHIFVLCKFKSVVNLAVWIMCLTCMWMWTTNKFKRKIESIIFPLRAQTFCFNDPSRTRSATSCMRLLLLIMTLCFSSENSWTVWQRCRRHIRSQAVILGGL